MPATSGPEFGAAGGGTTGATAFTGRAAFGSGRSGCGATLRSTRGGRLRSAAGISSPWNFGPAAGSLPIRPPGAAPFPPPGANVTRISSTDCSARSKATLAAPSNRAWIASDAATDTVSAHRRLRFALVTTPRRFASATAEAIGWRQAYQIIRRNSRRPRTSGHFALTGQGLTVAGANAKFCVHLGRR